MNSERSDLTSIPSILAVRHILYLGLLMSQFFILILLVGDDTAGSLSYSTCCSTPLRDSLLVLYQIPRHGEYGYEWCPGRRWLVKMVHELCWWILKAFMVRARLDHTMPASSLLRLSWALIWSTIHFEPLVSRQLLFIGLGLKPWPMYRCNWILNISTDVRVQCMLRSKTCHNWFVRRDWCNDIYLSSCYGSVCFGHFNSWSRTSCWVECLQT